MTIREALLARIQAFLAAHDMSERRFGLLVANDHKFVERLRSHSVTLERIERAERFMAEHESGAASNDSTPPAAVAGD